MAHLINLKLINTVGVPLAYPGLVSSFEVGSETSVEKVLIGVSADGSTNQIYPIGTSIAAITATFPRVYEGIQITGGAADGNVYLNSLNDFEYLSEQCCSLAGDQGSESEAPLSCLIPLYWIFIPNNGGSLVITENGVEILNVTEAGQGVLLINSGSDISMTVDSTGDHILTSYTAGAQAGNTFGSGVPVNLTFDDVVCGEGYAMIGETSSPPPG